MSEPKDRYINPDIGYYGQNVKIGDSCYIATGRVGDMTDYFEHKPATFSLKDHACVCDHFDMNASDHVTDSLQLGSGSELGHFDASTRRVDIETIGEDHYINLQHNSLVSSNQFTQPTSYLFAGWIKMRETVGLGHREVNIFDHRGNGSGLKRFGYIIALSSNRTSNDGSLSVLIGKGTSGDGWNAYSVPDMRTWTKDTKYHIAVLQINNKLKLYVNNEKKLDVTTSTIVSNGPRNVQVNSTTIPPVSIERYTYMTNIPDLPETFINQHYNRIVPTPRST